MARRIIRGQPYVSLPEAARRLGVSHMTLYRWATGRVPLNGFTPHVKVVKDPISGHYYIAEESIEQLDNRFQPV